MADPQTSNVGLAVPTRGSNVGVWDTPVNADFNALDGLFGGVLSLTLSNANIALTAPAGFTAAPSPGPVQSQNAVIRLTGAQSGNLTITLPAPGYYIIDNQVSTLTPLTTFRGVGSGDVVCVPQGMQTHIFNDGTNVRFVDLGMPGELVFLAGVSAIPAWILACSPWPYLPCEGGIFTASGIPALALRLGATFGGNGTTTIGVPDLRGRYPLAYDGTGSRITSGGCGIAGQTLGAAGGNQLLQSHTHGINIISQGMNAGDPHNHQVIAKAGFDGGTGLGSGPFHGWDNSTLTTTSTSVAHGHFVTGASDQAGNGSSQNIPPTQVAGIWLIKT